MKAPLALFMRGESCLQVQGTRWDIHLYFPSINGSWNQGTMRRCKNSAAVKPWEPRTTFQSDWSEPFSLCLFTPDVEMVQIFPIPRLKHAAQAAESGAFLPFLPFLLPILTTDPVKLGSKLRLILIVKLKHRLFIVNTVYTYSVLCFLAKTFINK